MGSRYRRIVLKSDIYPMKFAFHLGPCSHGSLEGWARKLGMLASNERLKDIRDTAEGCCYHLDYGALIWMEKVPERASDYSKLMHELVHAACHTAEVMGFSLEGGEEYYAYCVGWLSGELFKRLW